MHQPYFSVIIPVYNRPQEVRDILLSLNTQTYKDFEVLVVEDGSTLRCENIVDEFRDHLKLQYFFKPNTGPGPSRNFGYSQAKGKFFVVFDSDCILPPHYFQEVIKSLQENQWDAWEALIRHGKILPFARELWVIQCPLYLRQEGFGEQKNGWDGFQPRSFNMGISRRVYEVTNGFKFDRFAEDIEFSIRIKRGGFKVGLIPNAFVYHKRRINFSQFYHQVYNFGRGRALVGKVYPEEVKAAHWFPSFFLLGSIALPLLPFISVPLFWTGLTGFVSYLLAIFAHSLFENKNLTVAVLSVPAALCQLWGYGLGFLNERFKASP